MRTWWTMLVVSGVLMSAASSGYAQSGEPPAPVVPSRTTPEAAGLVAPAPSLNELNDAERAAELQQWIDDFTSWQDWWAKWRSRRQPGLFTGSAARRPKPDPPAWLPDRCLAVAADTDPTDVLARACARLVEWREDEATTQARQGRAARVAQAEAPTKTSWWEHLHMDLMWPAMQVQQNIFGVVGMHATTTVAGRWQVFTAPGVTLLNLPAKDGTRVWKVAANYGLGYRLGSFTFPGGRPAQLHVNLAKTWILSDAVDLAVGRTVDFVGFSITFKKPR